jgi:hypothetical protein
VVARKYTTNTRCLFPDDLRRVASITPCAAQHTSALITRCCAVVNRIMFSHCRALSVLCSSSKAGDSLGRIIDE